MNITFLKTEASDVAKLKQGYLQRLVAPMDGMWECFVGMADHYLIKYDDAVAGYCVINSENQLLQFDGSAADDNGKSFSQMLIELNVTGAIVATCEFQTLSLCMDHQKSVNVNAFMYHPDDSREIEESRFPPQTEFRLLETGELATATEFGVETLGANRDWLSGYFAERIAKRELYGLWQGQLLIATGECRPSESQKPFADLGMVVSKNNRRQGIATAILRRLLVHCRDNGLKAICSTESKNLGAQKAIEKAGFVSHHRILEVDFEGS